MRHITLALVALFITAALVPHVYAQDPSPGSLFEAADVFQMEWVADPQISPDGSQIVYVRTFNDIMSDRIRSNLWTGPSTFARSRCGTRG